MLHVTHVTHSGNKHSEALFIPSCYKRIISNLNIHRLKFLSIAMYVPKWWLNENSCNQSCFANENYVFFWCYAFINTASSVEWFSFVMNTV